MKKMMLARKPSAQTVDLAEREGKHARKAKGKWKGKKRR